MHAYLSICRIAPFLAAGILLATVEAGHWPAWRGSFDGSGAAHGEKAPVRWSSTENVRWKIDLPAPGNSSPIVWNDRVLIAQASEDGTRRSLLCFQRSDGSLLWQSGVTYAEPEESHRDNPQASSTPVTDGERVIVWFGSAGLFCFDMDGKELWRRDLGKQEHQWGYGASPVLFEDLCILNFGPGQRAFLFAFEKATGRTVWTVAIPEIKPQQRTDGFAGNSRGVAGSWSTPILVEAAGRTELIMSYPEMVRAFEPKTGTELWRAEGLNPLVYTSPLHADGVVVAMGGFFGNHLAVRTGGSGNVTGTHRLWHQVRAKSNIGTGVIHEGHIYLMNGSIAQCWELNSGHLLWEERVRGLGASSDSWSSMVRVEDRLYVLNHSGDTVILRASPAFEVIAVNSLGGERCNSTVAISNGELFIRTHKRLWCIGS